jgi:NADH-quinone oxidoreductase subunit A
MTEYLPLLFILFLGSIIAIGAILVGKILGYQSKNTKNKFAPYECGMPSFGTARIQFKVEYYIFALLFLIFDIEALFLFPIVANLKEILSGEPMVITPMIVVLDLIVFVSILFSGLIYAWKKGFLKWE